ncbi:MAG: PP2C family protein-serine/threonine phosphatase [Candidatus Eremiobacteraeota bacterium]|nr:PP2C family protein-serine/threonine phosphatase [Candidatus Eremiobacteraeota bacterium]
MRLKRLMVALRKLDRKIVSLAVELPEKKYRIGLMMLVVALIAACALILHLTRRDLHFDLFFIPLMAGCLFFRLRGFYFFPLALLAFHLASIRPEMTFIDYVLKDFIEVIKWSLLSLIVVLAVNKFVDVKKFEERMKRDVDLAKALQKTLLSKAFDLERIRVLGYIHQCMEVGGDFYYFRPFKKKHVVLAIGDVMGKGIPASLVMAVIMSFFYEWGKKSYSPAFILDKINRRLIDLWGEGSWYSTMFYSILDEETRELTYSNAGHQKGIIIRGSGSIELLEAEGFPVGVFSANQWLEKKTVLFPGDKVILFTDGVSEARSPEGQLFSFPRLLDRIKEARDSSLEDILEHILEDVKRHSGTFFESDDVALVMMEVKGKSPQPS